MILYLDPFMGIAGDMTVGALVDAGADRGAVQAALSSLQIEGLSFSFETVTRQGLRATLASPRLPRAETHRRLPDILALLARAELPQRVRETASAVFRRLAEAEAAVHGCPVDKVHFHEVGALDAIADVVGACAAWHALGAPEVECGPLNLGSGFTRMEHGTFPVPPPAVAELVRGVPVFSAGPPMERTTPTGAALAVTLASRFGPLPEGNVRAVGYGAGTRDPEGAPNVLRVFCLSRGPADNRVALIETQIDDMTPELLGGALEELRAGGALDVFTTPIQAKKHRPAWLVSVVSPLPEAERLADLLLEHTTTTGVRISEWRRRELPRELRTLDTPYGPLRVKALTLPSGKVRLHPEWEDVKALAAKEGVPAREIAEALSRWLD
ncbi:MAG: nickel pincer cofactor biosynthesis protein LarC [Acidobacteriota bacterium]